MTRGLEIVRLRHTERLSFRQIAEQLEMDDAQVHREYHRAARAFVPLADVKAEREAALDRYDQLDQRLLEVLRTPHYLAHFGKLAMDADGNLVLDDGPVLAAIRELRANERARASILGYDAPRQQPVLVMTEALVQAAIAQRRAELADAGPDDADQDQVSDAELIDEPAGAERRR